MLLKIVVSIVVVVLFLSGCGSSSSTVKEDGYAKYIKKVEENGSFTLAFDIEQGVWTHHSFVLLDHADDKYTDENDFFIQESTTLICNSVNEEYQCLFDTVGSIFTLRLSPYLYLKEWRIGTDMQIVQSDVLETISAEGIVEGLKE